MDRQDLSPEFTTIEVSNCGLPTEGLQFAYQDNFRQFVEDLTEERAAASIHLYVVPGKRYMVEARRLTDKQIRLVADRMSERAVNTTINRGIARNRNG